MAYKARRTRDLQGEVQAGTNMSVSETTKPDGTKVYTLSADGGEIPTLADIANSSATIEMGTYYFKYDGYYYLYPGGTSEIIQPTKNDFYQQDVTTNFAINGNHFVGIQIKQSGLYHISFNQTFVVNTTDIPTNKQIYCSISVINGTNLDNIEEKSYSYVYMTEIGTNEYSFYYVFDSFVELAENDVLGFYIEANDSNIYNITFNTDPILTIQKVR
jgi:hypothetical protein